MYFILFIKCTLINNINKMDNSSDIYLQYKSKLQKDGLYLKYIEDQTDELCSIAVNECGLAIKFVKKQTKDLCIQAINNFPFAIKYIKEPTEELNILAVQKYGMALESIKNPSEEVCREAVHQTAYAIKYIENPSEEVKKLAKLSYAVSSYDDMIWRQFIEFEFKIICNLK